MKKCMVEGCALQHSAKGYCNKHYQRILRGQALSDPTRKTLTQRIEGKVRRDPVTGCQVWQGAVSGGCDGSMKYGYIRVSGKSLRVHRVAYEIHNGPIPVGMVICHSCDNPLCVNPDHMTLGTQNDNMQDMIEKRRARHAVGEANNSKLKESEVLEMLSLSAKGASASSLATRYGVHPATIRKIVLGKKWAYLHKDGE